MTTNFLGMYCYFPVIGLVNFVYVGGLGYSSRTVILFGDILSIFQWNDYGKAIWICQNCHGHQNMVIYPLNLDWVIWWTQVVKSLTIATARCWNDRLSLSSNPRSIMSLSKATCQCHIVFVAFLWIQLSSRVLTTLQ